jgi:hydroxyethylthiazole kinase-like uncharacterized protein yjeF
MPDKIALLTNEEMALADKAAVARGIPGLALMEAAGRAVAEAARAMVEPRERILVLCGPGNNGGDGFVAARVLAEAGYDVTLLPLVAVGALKGDAAHMAALWRGTTGALAADSPLDAPLVVDALFGAGLTRPLEGTAAAVVERLNREGRRVLAVDVPSGLNGSSGEALGGLAVRAARTVTFFRRKPGHLLLPGRLLCGEVVLADIGIPDAVLEEVVPRTWANAPDLWLDHLPQPRLDGHKYARGHAVVVSGPVDSTGAARLAARAALRIGAGLVTVASPPDALPVNAAQLTAIMTKPFDGPGGLAGFLADSRRNAVLIGPGLGFGEGPARLVATVLEAGSGPAAVLDADALTAYAGRVQELAEAILARPQRPVVLTPHEGEFARLVGDRVTAARSKLERARAAAKLTGAVLVLKGADTVIAAPDGRAAINENAPPWLATAGTGDVLAGLIAGLLAQRMPAFLAACAAVWLHGAAADVFGQGLIAEDLSEMLPRVLSALRPAGAAGWQRFEPREPPQKRP